MIIKNTAVFTKDRKFEQLDIVTKGERIDRLVFKAACDEKEEVIDGTGLYAIPGLVDIHFHGAVGHDFCDASLEGLEEIAKFEASKGVLAICPATMTFPEEKLRTVMETAKEYLHSGRQRDGAKLVGINMEGPFLSPEKIGAQNPTYLAKPDYAMFARLQEASGGLIKLVDLAPELKGAEEFIRQAKDQVKLSLAHTDCDYERAEAAFRQGISHVTHLFNAMNDISHRKPGPVMAALEQKAEVELICDGVHVDPAMVRFVFQVFDPDKIILISDSMEACGLEDGQYRLGGQEVTVKGNLATLTEGNGAIAGSVTNLYDCMKKAMEFGVPREKAIAAATINPSESIGISGDYGSIEAGKPANLLLVDEEFEIQDIVQEGRILPRTSSVMSSK